MRRLQMPFEGLSFVKTLVKFGIVFATDPLLHNVANIVDSVDLPSMSFCGSW